ncbi:Spy/CpxP family protein refolding chaperone [Rugamonas rubra]|uniref:Protein refolding chaperone Spy/CpxP family n=1 Tax=Rugamonas rubra TaxID=758825 RepID=A0A1I4S8K4_9BURK|nr:periplasmic heavy metal sensor [Rugamonas rubra]SFM60634.1 protein refolding chaperone Spy/CpxP family [Rugamonas rubra]
MNLLPPRQSAGKAALLLVSALSLAGMHGGGAAAEDDVHGPAHGGHAPGHDAGGPRGPYMAPHGADGARNTPPGTGRPPFGPAGMPGTPPFLLGLELSEAQQDKVFALLHAQVPYLREQEKSAWKAHEGLRALGAAVPFDDAKAAALAQAAGQAHANIMLQQVRTEQKLLALLTPEQRRQQADEAPRHPPRP